MPMTQDWIDVRGARVHNLRNIDVKIPRDKLVVITGLSGSGKSSLAFDTVYAEGQRRYVESLSAYARQFLEQVEKPDVDQIEGLSPAISIEQRTTGSNPRSTVGTVTEIYDYLRLLFANVGKPHCPSCGREVTSQSVEQIVDAVMNGPTEERINLLAPIVRGRKGEFHRHSVLLDVEKPDRVSDLLSACPTTNIPKAETFFFYFCVCWLWESSRVETKRSGLTGCESISLPMAPKQPSIDICNAM